MAVAGRGCVLRGLVSAVERDDAARLEQALRSLDDHQLKHHAGGVQQLAKCLYIAAARARLRCARLLVDAGAQPNIRGDTNGNTPLVRIQRYDTIRSTMMLLFLTLQAILENFFRLGMLIMIPVD